MHFIRTGAGLRIPATRARRSFGERCRAAMLGTIVVLLATGCDQQKVAELEPGVATEAEVRARFGTPSAIYDEANGGQTLEYSRQPSGTTNYMAAIGADGRLVSLRQVLVPATFARVKPGLEKVEVRRLLGRPAKVQAYALKNEEVWDWRFADSLEVKVFSVTFGADGRVTGTATTLDPREAGQRG
jgi:outer membrane protein assembly factor BamE (lipoprotein component of BamABCDE complex)